MYFLRKILMPAILNAIAGMILKFVQGIKRDKELVQSGADKQAQKTKDAQQETLDSVEKSADEVKSWTDKQKSDEAMK